MTANIPITPPEKFDYKKPDESMAKMETSIQTIPKRIWSGQGGRSQAGQYSTLLPGQGSSRRAYLDKRNRPG